MTIANERTDEALVIADPEPVEVVLPARPRKKKHQRQDAEVAKAIADAQAQGFTVVSTRKVKKNLWELVLEPPLALEGDLQSIDGGGDHGTEEEPLASVAMDEAMTEALVADGEGVERSLPDADTVEEATHSASQTDDALKDQELPHVADDQELAAPEALEPQADLPSSAGDHDSSADEAADVPAMEELPQVADDQELAAPEALEPQAGSLEFHEASATSGHGSAASDDAAGGEGAMLGGHGIFGHEQFLADDGEDATSEEDAKPITSITSLEDDGDDLGFAELLASAEAILQASVAEVLPSSPPSVESDGDDRGVEVEDSPLTLEDDDHSVEASVVVDPSDEASVDGVVDSASQSEAFTDERDHAVPDEIVTANEETDPFADDALVIDDDLEQIQATHPATDDVAQIAAEGVDGTPEDDDAEAMEHASVAELAGLADHSDDQDSSGDEDGAVPDAADAGADASLLQTPPSIDSVVTPPLVSTSTDPVWLAPESPSTIGVESEAAVEANLADLPIADAPMVEERPVSPSVALAAQFAQPKKSRFGRNRKEKAAPSSPKGVGRPSVKPAAAASGEGETPRPPITIDPRTGRPVQQPPVAERSEGDRSSTIAATKTQTESSSSTNQRVPTPLHDHLVEQGIATAQHLDEAHRRMVKVGGTLLESLVANQVVSADALTEAIAAFSNLPVTDLSRERLDADALDLVPEEVAREHMVFPMRVLPDALVVACAEPSERIMRLLAQASGLKVEASVARSSDIRSAIDRNYHALSGVAEIVEEFEADQAPRKRTAVVANQEADPENAPIVRVVNRILSQAMREGASDVHIEPADDIVRVRNRVDGVLKVVLVLPASMGLGLVSRIKIMAEMNIVERRRPQDGMFTAMVDGRSLDVRVATVATIWGEACVLRLLDKSKSLLSIAELGMATDTHAAYSKLIRAPFGMVLCVGPTGSGKTTTLYASLTEISDTARNVMTIEDPVEYVFPSINQIQTNEQAGLTFATGLKSILRQDSDVVLVGEIRDVETARIAIQSTLTGHFVLSSVHATDAIGALTRFIDMGIESFLIASSVIGLVGQRLVRRICVSCKEPYAPTDEEMEFYRSAGGPEKTAFFRGAGCNSCGHTGFKGRVGIYELVPMTPELKREIVAGAKEEELRALARAQGVRSMRDEAVALIARDETTSVEVIRSIYAI